VGADQEVKDSSILISIVCNLFLVLIKGITGLLANSSGLVADAIHSMSDVTAFFINYRACKECENCSGLNKQATNENSSQIIFEIETKATYYTGIFLLIIGMAVYFYNSMILILGRSTKPEPIAAVIAFVALAFYAVLYKYLENSKNSTNTLCTRTVRNVDWQNKLNLFSGSVVLFGLAASMFGFYFMDDIAAIIVGSILIGIGINWITETRDELNPIMKQRFKVVIISCIPISVVITAVSLSINF
jgi:divalent metal cation (Fe/Co/Zn/Cd) transporter